MGHRVHAVDFSSVGQGKTARLALDCGVPVLNSTNQVLVSTAGHQGFVMCHQADVTTWMPPEGPASLDVVVACFCHIPASLKPLNYANLSAMLKPGMQMRE
jgi:hypothetical protein